MPQSNGDWMPSTIQGRIDMGRNWVNILQVKGTAWKVPAAAAEFLQHACLPCRDDCQESMRES